MSDETVIRAGIEDRVRAVRSKDVEGLLAGYAENVVTFDLILPLANTGLAAVRKRVTEWFGSFESAIDYEVRDVSLAVAGEVAFEHHFTHVRGTSRLGQEINMWFRETLGYRKIDGKWKVTHQHSSVPLEMVSGKGRLDLKP